MSVPRALLHLIVYKLLVDGHFGRGLVHLFLVTSSRLCLPHDFHEALMTCKRLQRVFTSTARALGCEEPLPSHDIFVTQYTSSLNWHGSGCGVSRGYADSSRETLKKEAHVVPILGARKANRP